MKAKTKANTTFRNGNLFCLNCGGEHKITIPMPVKDMGKNIEAFNTLHKDCLPTWKEPEADQSQSIKEKAMWWIANGEQGLSSKTMWLCLMGQKVERVSYPYDPDDFSRCYKLLQAVPEWKTHLYLLKPLCPQWSNLVDNWDKLTEMYEQNKRENWLNHEEVGMYQLMCKLTELRNE
jgi:hypothetical protein